MIDAPVPDLLLDLLSEEPEYCGEVLAYLDTAALHQGTPSAETAACARYVAGVLADDRTTIRCVSDLPWDDRERPLRVALLDWLARAGEAAARDDDSPAAAACRGIRGELAAAVLPWLTDLDEATRKTALDATAQLLRAPDLAELRAAQVRRLARPVPDATPVERATAALALDLWGHAPHAYLTDADPMVRAVAATTTTVDDDPAALAETRRALADLAVTDTWPSADLPLLGATVRAALVRALLRRTRSFGEIVAEAVAVVRVGDAYTVDGDWGPLLARAFPAPHPDGAPFSPAQQAFLAEVVERDECWRGTANPTSWFVRAGLPHDRAALRQ